MRALVLYAPVRAASLACAQLPLSGVVQLRSQCIVLPTTATLSPFHPVGSDETRWRSLEQNLVWHIFVRLQQDAETACKYVIGDARGGRDCKNLKFGLSEMRFKVNQWSVGRWFAEPIKDLLQTKQVIGDETFCINSVETPSYQFGGIAARQECYSLVYKVIR